MTRKIIELSNVSKSFTAANDNIQIFKNLNLTLLKSQKMCLIGDSGSGKTTLMNIMNFNDTPDTGKVAIEGKIIKPKDLNEINQIRQNKISSIYQFHFLLPEFSVIENVCLPLEIIGFSKKDAIERSASILEKVGLIDKRNESINYLSGGEQQRTAVARALAKEPDIILADEPTGNLDPKNARIVFEMLLDISDSMKSTVFCITHNQNFAKEFDSVVTISNSQIEYL